jgi:putative ABC transport system permease protein
MNLIDTISMIRVRLKRKKLRTSLAVLGILVGIMAVTAITTIGNSGERAVFAEFSKMGINGVNIKKRIAKTSSPKSLIYNDVRLAKKSISDTYISGVYSNLGTVQNNGIERDSYILGVDSDFYRIASLKISEGRFISNSDNDNQNMVCVIDSYTKKKLYNNENVLGKTIKLSTVYGENSFTICGILENSSGVMSDSIPLFMYIPANSIQKVFHTDKLDYLSVVSMNENKLEEKSNEVLKLIESESTEKDIFYIDNINKEKQNIQNASSLLKNIIGAIALISLIVGGIGVMNIMLVSVSERTREIGIKKSIGAKNSDILFEFLIEAMFITLFAAILGLGFGIVISFIIASFLEIEFLISFSNIANIFLISFLTGLIFGGCPALIAGNLDPVVALRSE